MSLWMICTYYIYNVLDDFFLKSKIKKKKIIIFGILTAYLLSIRISGILIFLEYLFFLILFLKSYNYSFNRFLKDFYKETKSKRAEFIIENYDSEIKKFAHVVPDEVIDKLEFPVTKKSKIA